MKVQNRATDHSGVWAADGGWEHGCMPMTSTAAWKRLLNRHRPPVCNLLSRYVIDAEMKNSLSSTVASASNAWPQLGAVRVGTKVGTANPSLAPNVAELS